MKLIVKIICTSAILLASVGVLCTHQSDSKSQSSDIALANIEALTYDLEKVTITCSTGHKGYCFRVDNTQWIMCNWIMVFPCVYTGYQADYCTHDC